MGVLLLFLVKGNDNYTFIFVLLKNKIPFGLLINLFSFLVLNSMNF